MRLQALFVVAVLVVVVGCGGDANKAPSGPECSNGVDDDGDGKIDFPDDLGCSNAQDDSEDSAALPQCNDGRDNDGDGKIDYPNDPGCLVAQQDTETDDCPDGPGCPQCSNGKDDDANGLTDYPNDPGCTSAGDFDEYTQNPNACGAGITIHQLPATGMVSGMVDGMQLYPNVSPCGGGGSSGIDVAAYELHLTEPKVIVASTAGSEIDTVLDIRGAACNAADSELACNDNDANLTSSKIAYSAQPGTYYILVETRSGAAGNFMLTVQQLAGEGTACTDTSECGPGLVCRIPHGGTEMSCEKPVCNDGRDDDGDGKIDYPSDPGCTSPDDTDETDDCPSGAGCPACANGVDDDNDGATDYPADTSCTSASGNSEACQGEEDPITAIMTATTSGTLVGAHDNHDPTCGGDGGGDILYTLTVPAMRSLVLDTEGTTGDTLLSIMTAACSEPSIACDDDGGTSGSSSRLALSNLAAGTYIVAVDNYNGTKPPAPYDLHVTGVIQPGGSCNPSDTLGGALQCPVSNPCSGTTGNLKCQPSACGDGQDNDGDGKTDFPDDPGCASADDTDETDSCPGAGPNCPECADGVDNDGDGQIDYPNDTNCTSPGQASEGCPSTDGVTALTTSVTDDSTTGANNDVHPTCSSSSEAAPDHTFSLQLPALKSLSIVGSSSFDGVLALYDSTCGGAPLSCQDGENISLQDVAAGNYFLVIDGYSTGSGTTTLTVSGVIQNGGSCESPLAQNGALVCASGFACAGTPGSRTCRPAACNDGRDNDGDGIADYPNDPGCASVSDNDESDSCPGGAGCPACSDGLDNDGDGMIDYPDDPSCSAASGTSEACASSEQVVALVAPSTPGTTVNSVNDVAPTCGSSSNTAGDLTYSLTVPALSSLTITNTNSFDAAVELLDSTCGGAPLQCKDEPETIQVGPLAAGTYYYVVDGYGSSTGAYTITVAGTIKNGASCEGTLADTGALTCGAGYACKGVMGARTCEPLACSDGVDNDGDGKIDFPFEPGCDSPSDDDETDPATPSVCSNGADDDNDMATDFPADYGCSSAAGTSEIFCAPETNPTALITTTPVTGTTMGLTSDFASHSCQSSSSGPDTVLALQLPVAVDTLVLDLSSSSYDTVLSVRDLTCGTELGCDDDSGDPGAQSKLTMTSVAAGSYAVVIDGYSGNSGAYTLAVHGTLAAGTRCDSALFTAGVLSCASGLTCSGSPATCH